LQNFGSRVDQLRERRIRIRTRFYTFVLSC
jgi:hypothetical protein